MKKICASVLAVLLTACQNTVPQAARDTDSLQEMQQVLQSGQSAKPAPATPPDAIMDAMLPPLDPSDAAVEERFDLSVNSAPARDFFLGLVRGTDINMVVHPEVTGNISLDLRNVSVAEVMSVVGDVYGYPWERSANMYRVMPSGLRTEIYKLDYLDVRRRGRSETQVRAGQVTDAGESDTGGRRDDDESSRDGGQSGSSGKGVVGTSIQTSGESDFWNELQRTLAVIIGEGEGRQVVVTPQAGMVVVRAMPRELASVSDYLEQAEMTLQRQVILEAKILEVQLNEGFQSGIDWQALSETSNRTISASQGSAALTDLNQINGIFGLSVQTDEFAGLIELLATQGSVQVLSSPRISTINNQKAVIKVGTDEFFVTEVSTVSTVSSGSTTTTPSIELTPFFSGIALDVTPQISGDDEIILHVHPSVSEVADQNKSITLGGERLDLPLALSTIRESDSVIYARSGQLVVIGGLMQNTSRDVNSGAPILKDLPGVGGLFRQTRQRSVKSELVILLRPLVTSPETWRDQLNDSAERFGTYEKKFKSGNQFGTGTR